MSGARVSPTVSRGRAVTEPPRFGKWVRARMHLVTGVLVLLFAAIAYEAWGLQVDQADHFRALAERQQRAVVEVPAPRGMIYDAAGRELAVTANIDSIFANPHEVVDVGGTAERLAGALGLDQRDLEARLASPRYFVWLARHVSTAQAKAVRALALPGVGLQPEPRRFYPGQALAGAVLGLAGVDGKGLAGIELSMDGLLAGKPVSYAALRDASGALLLDGAALAPDPGAQVTLTLDRSIQFIAERVLGETVAKYKARAGVVVVLDVATSGVLAMASAPAIDPNAPDRAEPGARNRTITDVYEIGSVMKIFTIAAALDAGVVAPDTVFDVEGGSMTLGSKIIRDTHHDQELTVAGILKRSSNVGAVKIGRRLGKVGLHDALARFGFGRPTDVELPGEQAGQLRPAEAWGDIGLATISFGYGLSVTPLQIAAGVAAIGHGGIYTAPRVVDHVRDAAGNLRYTRQAVSRRVVSEATASKMLPILAGVFDKGPDGGTGQNLVVSGFIAGGKTGTAHKLDPISHKYSDHLYLSSFAGLAPIDHPRIAVLVLIDEPTGDEHFGAQVAGPAWAEITSETLRYLGEPASPGAAVAVDAASAPRVAAQPASLPSSPAPEPPPAIANADGSAFGPDLDDASATGATAAIDVPDFRGFGMAHAIALAHERGLELTVEGSGIASWQSLAPGPARNSAECHVVFAPPGG